MQRITLFLACFFIFCADLIAQQYPFVFYTPKNGLVNSRVRKMYQDSRGRLYFITYGGLSVYDGARFRNYTTLDGLGSDMVNDVMEIGEDSLLVAPNASKVNVLVKGKMKIFQTANNFYPTINNFLKSTDGSIYVTADEGLFLLKGDQFEELKFPLPGMPAVLPFLGSIAEAGDILIIGTNDLRAHKGVYLYDKKKRKLTDVVTDPRLDAIEKDKQNRIWIGMNSKLYMLDSVGLANGKFKPSALPAPYQQLSDQHASSFAFDDNNNAWLLLNPKEILRLGNDGTLSKIKLTGDQGGHEIFLDKENILWICSLGGGTYKLANPSLQIDGTLSGPDRQNGINDASITKDTTWFIVNSKQLVRQTSLGTQLFTTNITDPFIGGCHQLNGRLFLCTIENLFVAALPSQSSKEVVAKKLIAFPDGSFGGVMVKDPYGNLIVTESSHVSVIKNDSIIFRHTLVSNDLVQALRFDKHNRLWMGSRYGLYVFALHPENPSGYMQEIHNFKKTLGQDVSPRCMVLDKNDNVWVGTRYDGVFGFTYTNNDLKRILHVQTKDGLTDNFVISLACDSSNMIMVGTQTGLDRLIPGTDNSYRIENITKSNGVFGYINNTWVDPNNQSHALINNNTVLHISPLSVVKGIYNPRLFIEEMKVNGIVIDSKEKVQLSYTQRNIDFNVAAPAFADEQQVKYSYLLEGSSNNEWSEPSSSADINFLNLQPGKYALQVKAIFPSTNYLPQQLSYSFEIVPPWWQTTWFRILAGILTVSILMLVLRSYYARKLEKQKVILESQQAIEKERTRIATDMHDDLGAGLSRIKFLSETIGIKKQTQQPIEEDITKIREYSHDMIDKMGEIVWALNKHNDTLSDLLSYTRAYTVEYLSQNGIQCVVEAPEQFPSQNVAGDFRRNIYLTVKEALHNIVKHSQATRVNISMVTPYNTVGARCNLVITIADNGTGFDEKKIRPFSNGLNNMRKRMESVGGELRIKNENGTSVVLSVPMS